MRLVMAGINHDTAPVECREGLSFLEEECERALESLMEEKYVSEALLISTCNRTELYVRAAADPDFDSDRTAKKIIQFLVDFKNVEVKPENFYIRYDEPAIRHLFKVSAGLNSMIKGEAQILSQVKAAYRIGCKARSCGFFMHKLLHAAFRAGKRARTETDIGVGAVSVSLAAVELSERIFHDISRKKALVVGAGEMAALTGQHFVDKGIASLTVINRTEEKARELAAKLDGRAAPFENLVKEIAAADVVIVSTAAPNYIVTPSMLKEAMRARRNKSIFVMDISVPRNVDPQVGRLYNVFSHDIDDLKQIVDANMGRREMEIPKVHQIIDFEIKEFADWYSQQEITPTIKDLISYIDDIRREEIRKNAKHFSEEQLEHVDLLTRSIVKKILHHPITKLRATGSDEAADTPFWVNTVRNVFNLGKKTDG